MELTSPQFKENARVALADPLLQSALLQVETGFVKRRAAAVAYFVMEVTAQFHRRGCPLCVDFAVVGQFQCARHLVDRIAELVVLDRAILQLDAELAVVIRLARIALQPALERSRPTGMKRTDHPLNGRIEGLKRPPRTAGSV